ncbi:hypothetical protein ACIBCA_01740 [Kitasatospora sp. NPDC051170]|uniref:hypothetical protein n=1 Tax=Kitasatospora sp. NPDC051170 TaxID=3364056 RepID=UPI0037893923
MSNDATVLLREGDKEVRRLFREYRALADGVSGSDGARGRTVFGRRARRPEP